MLGHLIYVSESARPMTADDLEELLEETRSRNDDCRITGMLLYKNGRFMQLLEGEEEDVVKIYRSIERDDRHKEVRML